MLVLFSVIVVLDLVLLLLLLLLLCHAQTAYAQKKKHKYQSQFYISLPILFYVLEKDISERTLLRIPKLYQTSREGTQYTALTLLQWFIRALFHAAILAIFSYQCAHGRTRNIWGENSQISNALVTYTAAVLIQPLTIFVESTYFTILNLIVIWGMYFSYFIINCILASFNLGSGLDYIMYFLY